MANGGSGSPGEPAGPGEAPRSETASGSGDAAGPAPADPGEVVELRPPDAWAFLALAHGSGAGMRHSFMESLARRLADQGIATLRYEFPYMAAGKPFPDRPPILVERVRAAVAEAARRAGPLPLFAGGKSLGGRMTSTAESEGELPGVCGLVFFGFPLHPARKPGTKRAEHLPGVQKPLLFLQGDRDALADLQLLEPRVQSLGDRARLVVLEGADHGFQVLKRSGRTPEDILDELAGETARWMKDQLAGKAAGRI